MKLDIKEKNILKQLSYGNRINIRELEKTGIFKYTLLINQEFVNGKSTIALTKLGRLVGSLIEEIDELNDKVDILNGYIQEEDLL